MLCRDGPRLEEDYPAQEALEDGVAELRGPDRDEISAKRVPVKFWPDAAEAETAQGMKRTPSSEKALKNGDRVIFELTLPANLPAEG